MKATELALPKANTVSVRFSCISHIPFWFFFFIWIRLDDNFWFLIAYTHYQLLDNLKDLLRFLRRDDPQTRDVFKQVCKWNIVSKYLIPTIELYHEDRNLLLNSGFYIYIYINFLNLTIKACLGFDSPVFVFFSSVKVLVFLTMPIEPSSTDISQQLEYLWGLKSAVTNSDVTAVIVSFLERPLENLERWVSANSNVFSGVTSANGKKNAYLCVFNCLCTVIHLARMIGNWSSLCLRYLETFLLFKKFRCTRSQGD